MQQRCRETEKYTERKRERERAWQRWARHFLRLYLNDHRRLPDVPSRKCTFLYGRCLPFSCIGRSWGPRFSLDSELTRIPLRVARVLLGMSLFMLPPPISSEFPPYRHRDIPPLPLITTNLSEDYSHSSSSSSLFTSLLPILSR